MHKHGLTALAAKEGVDFALGYARLIYNFARGKEYKAGELDKLDREWQEFTGALRLRKR